MAPPAKCYMAQYISHISFPWSNLVSISNVAKVGGPIRGIGSASSTSGKRIGQVSSARSVPLVLILGKIEKTGNMLTGKFI